MRSLIIAAMLCISLNAVSQSVASAEPHVLVVADGLDLTSLNPLLPQAAPNYELNYITMAYFTRYGEGGQRAELLSTVPTLQNRAISADGKTITFKLRPNLKWSDGEPLTSADVAFTVALILNPKINSEYREQFKEIIRVDTPDIVTAVFRLSKAHGTALDDYFSSRSAPILPKHLLDGKTFETDVYQQLPVGAGPFRYTRWARSDRVELEPNPNFAGRPPKIKKIIFKLIPNTQSAISALRTGEINVMLALVYAEYATIKDLANIHGFVHAGVRPSYLALNNQMPILQDQVVRRALLLATDRATLLRTGFKSGGILSETIVSTADPYQAKIPLVAYDPRAAAALLESAGWKRGSDGVRVKNGTRLHVDIVGGSGATFVDQILEIMRDNWKGVGVEVETKRQPLNMMFAPAAQGGTLFGGKFDAALFSTGQTKSSQLETYTCGHIPPNGQNFPRFCNAAFDQLVAAYNASYDPKMQGSLALRTQQTMFGSTPLILIALRNEYDAYRDEVTGYHAYPYAFFPDPLNIDVTK